MRVGELAAAGGVTAKTVRFYESLGLLAPPRRLSNGYREYAPDAVDRLRFVRDAQAAGLSLAEAGEILSLKDAGRGTCMHTKAMLDRHMAEIDQQIASLLAAKAELTALSRRAESLDPADCTDANSCQVLSLDIPVHSNV